MISQLLPGDKVQCINNDEHKHLEINKIYNVDFVSTNKDRIYLKEFILSFPLTIFKEYNLLKERKEKIEKLKERINHGVVR